jgi:hypothetical protein
MQGSVPSPSRSLRLRRIGRKLILVPILSVAATVTLLPAQASIPPTAQGVYSSQGQAPDTTPAAPPANGRPAAVQTGRKSH